jgi:hypothetical protein
VGVRLERTKSYRRRRVIHPSACSQRRSRVERARNSHTPFTPALLSDPGPSRALGAAAGASELRCAHAWCAASARGGMSRRLQQSTILFSKTNTRVMHRDSAEGEPEGRSVEESLHSRRGSRFGASLRFHTGVRRMRTKIDGSSDIPSHLEHRSYAVLASQGRFRRATRDGSSSTFTARDTFHRDSTALVSLCSGHSKRSWRFEHSPRRLPCRVWVRPATLRRSGPMDVTPSNSFAKTAFSTSAAMQPADRSASSGPGASNPSTPTSEVDPSPASSAFGRRGRRVCPEDATRSRRGGAPGAHIVGCRLSSRRHSFVENPNEATAATKASSDPACDGWIGCAARHLRSGATSTSEDRSDSPSLGPTSRTVLLGVRLLIQVRKRR